SAVKDICFNYTNANLDGTARTIQILKRLVWFTAIFGSLVMIVGSTWLSEFAFETKEHAISSVWISVALLFKQLTNGGLAILQGLRKLKKLAKANFYGNLLALLITLPLYYIYRIEAIIPAIIVSSLVVCIFTFYYSHS